MKTIEFSFSFANTTKPEDKMAKLLSSVFVFYLPIYTKFMKPCRMDIKILLALKKDVRTYAAGNLIYGVIFDILHVIVEYRLTKKTFHCVVAVL